MGQRGSILTSRLLPRLGATNAYDRYGNRWIDLGGGSQSLYFNTSNRITNSGYSYDAAGNLLNDGAHAYTFDAENKISKVDTVSAYTYDGEGQRVRKLVGENLRFVYGIGGQMIAEFDGSNGSLKKEYIPGGTSLITIEPTALNANGTRYSTSDHLGSPRVVTNSSSGVVSRHDYKPFGEELGAGTGGRTTGMGFSVTDGVRQKFTQKERDNETGLDYFGARYYSSTQGRFISPDPLYFQAMMAIDPQRFNLYAYTRDNPMKFVDPSGEKLFLGGNEGWLRTNVLYEMVGGQENFDRYFQITDGQVVARADVDASGANAGVQQLLGLVNARENYLYFAGTDGAAAADLFEGSRDDKGNLTKAGKNKANEFEGNNEQRAGGSLVGTKGRTGGASQPAELANGDPVFAVIAYNTNAVVVQEKVDYSYSDMKEIFASGCAAVECAAQRAGVGKVVRPVSFFIHESTENQAFSRMGTDNSNYQFAHRDAQHREANIRQALHIAGGFAGGGGVQRTVPKP